jgi:hypothetical protein
VTRPKLLSIHYYYPPTGTIGRLRNYYFSCYAVRYFAKSYVISTKYSTLNAKENLDISHVEMQRVLNFDYRNISELLSKYRKKNITDTANAKGSSGIVKYTRQLMETLPLHFFIGEGGFLYILFGFFRGCQLVKSHQITHLYSSFRPYSDHCIGYLLKICFPHLFWIADFRDLPVDVARDNVLFPALQIKMNRYILSKANIVTTVSDGLAEHLKKLHTNVYVLRNGIHVLPSYTNSAQKNLYFTIAYTGSLYLNQTFQPLLVALKRLIVAEKLQKSHIQLLYAGKDSRMWQQGILQHDLQIIYKDMGLVDLQTANHIQQNANINLLLSWASPQLTGTLTGKLYEYIAAQQPILAIVNGTKDEELTNMIYTANDGLVFSTEVDDLQEMEAFILIQYANWRDGNEVKQQNTDKLRPFLWEKMMKDFMEKIDVR